MVDEKTGRLRPARVDTRLPAAGVPVRLHDVNTADGDRIEFGVLDRLSHGQGVPADLALIHVHGKGGNFYGLPFRALATRLNSPRLLHLSVNLRCHDLGYTRTDTPDTDSLLSRDVSVAGGWWERFDDGLEDLAAVTRYVREELRIDRIGLVGHSAGALYSTVYAVRDRSIVTTIQLSPLTSNKTNLPAWFPSAAQLDAFTGRARAMVADGRGHHILPLDVWYYGISADTFLERVSEVDDLWLNSMRRVDHPSMVIWAARESRSALWRSLVASVDRPNCVGEEIPDAEHNYIDTEDQLAALVDRFLTGYDYFRDTA